MAVDIEHRADPGRKLSLQRRFPSIQIAGVIRGNRSAVIGIAEKSAPRRRWPSLKTKKQPQILA
jgi:hypothetical protein